MAEWKTAGKVRTTPKGAWNSSTAYQVLDMVTNSDCTKCYIANKAVPAGTALTNTSYWTVVLDATNIEVPSPENWISLDEVNSLMTKLNS